MHISFKCDSEHCPQPNQQQHVISFNLQPPTEHSFDKQITSQFPIVGCTNGYCGTELHEDPPKNSMFGRNVRTNTETGIELNAEAP